MTDGPEKAKKLCIDYTNGKRQTALIVACKHGWVRHGSSLKKAAHAAWHFRTESPCNTLDPHATHVYMAKFCSCLTSTPCPTGTLTVLSIWSLMAPIH